MNEKDQPHSVASESPIEAPASEVAEEVRKKVADTIRLFEQVNEQKGKGMSDDQAKQMMEGLRTLSAHAPEELHRLNWQGALYLMESRVDFVPEIVTILTHYAYPEPEKDRDGRAYETKEIVDQEARVDKAKRIYRYGCDIEGILLEHLRLKNGEDLSKGGMVYNVQPELQRQTAEQVRALYKAIAAEVLPIGRMNVLPLNATVSRLLGELAHSLKWNADDKVLVEELRSLINKWADSDYAPWHGI